MTPAERYENWRQPLRLGESFSAQPARQLPELELQARWFAGRFPKNLRTTAGESVEIIHRGVWNREPGPDFTDAVVRLGNSEPQRGSIEIDTHLRDWEAHGHATNPTFNGVLLHLFFETGKTEFFSRTAENRLVPQARLALDDGETAFPVPPLALQGRCSAPLAALSTEVRNDLIMAAAHFRLRRKASAVTRLAAAVGTDEALFQTLAVTLGYKTNKLPFELLAQRIGLKTLRANHDDIDSLLFGCAGFLDATSLREFQPETRDYLRSLWERWWALRDRWQRFVLPVSAWNLSGARPANHPQRRLAALGLLVSHWPAVRRICQEPKLGEFEEVLTSFRHPYWTDHYTIRSRRAPAQIALLGKTRIIEMLVNAAIPAAMEREPEIWRTLETVVQPLENRTLKTGLLRLFGANQVPARFNVLQQQGVLQIYEDFCLRDLSDCSRCPFPEKVLRWEPAS